MTQQERRIFQIIEENPLVKPEEIAKKLNLSTKDVEESLAMLEKSGSIAGRGYVIKNTSYAVVVGGINVDIGGHSSKKIVPTDSNPGTVRMSLGGVGRNIAHNMALMGVNVYLLSAYGDDMNGERVAASCSEIGIDISRAQRAPGEATSTYLYITDEQGEMVLAINDMEICNKITPQYLERNLDLLQNAQVVVADANLSREALLFLAENLKVPFFVDPVSTIKADKIIPILDKIHTLKPNKIEAEFLSGVKIDSLEDAEKAAEVLIKKGVRRVFISMGEKGVFAATSKERLHENILKGERVNTTGCGDAFMGALVWAYLEGMELKETARAGLAAGAVAMETSETISPFMSANALRERMKNS